MIELTMDHIKTLLPKRTTASHKYTNGMVFAYVGSDTYPGAATLASKGALRSGAGGVYLYTTHDASLVALHHSPEIIPHVRSKNQTPSPIFLNKSKAYLVGCGLNFNDDKEDRETFIKFLKDLDKPTIFDAGALSFFALEGIDFLCKAIPDHIREQCVITPHEGEMKAMVPFLEDDVLIHFARTTRLTICLKGFPCKIITADGHIFFNTTGNPAATTAGCGDVFAGVCGGVMAQGLDALAATKVGAYLVGVAADLYIQEKGAHTILATDIIDMIPCAMRMLYT